MPWCRGGLLTLRKFSTLLKIDGILTPHDASSAVLQLAGSCSPDPSREHTDPMSNRADDGLALGEHDLQHARNALEDGDYDWACFAAHQAAEKSLKALLLKRGGEGALLAQNPAICSVYLVGSFVRTPQPRAVI